MSSRWWPFGNKGPSAEEQAARQLAANAYTLEQLQIQCDDQNGVASQYRDIVDELGKELKTLKPKTPKHTELLNKIKMAWTPMKAAERQAATLQGQINSLQGVTSNVRTMGTNMAVHDRIKVALPLCHHFWCAWVLV